MAGYPVNGSEISKKVYTALKDDGALTVKEISHEILEDEEVVSRVLHEGEGNCFQRVHMDAERWWVIAGEDDD